MTKTGLLSGWRFGLVAGLAVFASGAAALAATNAAPAPNETPIAVVAEAASVQAAFDKARASGLALVADLTLGHEGQLVRAMTAEPLAPGQYRLHALVACVAPDENGYNQLLGGSIALRLVFGGGGEVLLPSRAPKTESGGLRLAAGGIQGIVQPKRWDPKQEPAPVHFDFMVDRSGQMPVAIDWFVRDVSVNHEIRPAKGYELTGRQNAIDKLSLPGGPDKPVPAPDDAGLGVALDDGQAKALPRLAPRALAGEGLPPYRLLLAGLVIERLSPVVKVSVQGRECFTYHTPIAAFAGFDLAQAGRVEIECARAIQSVDVRPKSLGIRPEISGKKVSFQLQAPAYLSVEFGGESMQPLFLCADPPEQDAPKPGTPGVKFFAAGKVHEVGKVTLKSGETVYIERGAVVRGSFFMDEVKNVKILGRGVLDGGMFNPVESRKIEMRRAEDVVVEGVTLLDSRHWAVPILGSDRVTVRRVKIVSGNDWDDGVVVVGSRDVTVEKCFIRTKDSCVAIKAGGVTYFTQLDCQRDVENVVVRDCVLWSGMRGNGLEILTQGWPPDWVGKKAGFEPRAANIRKIRFTNNDLIHSEGPGGVLAIHTGDPATVSDVIYEDLRVEDALGFLADLKIRPSPYNRDAECGHIRDIVVRNIRVEGKDIPPSVLSGFDGTHPIEGVVFENVQAGGRKWTKLEDGPLQTKFATGVEFR
ncbi:MAG: hypothetical protein FJ225_02365 [Lentisphaerae bacterium]|nr:hypothetical protein [Lentisphaerota bacterium]